MRWVGHVACIVMRRAHKILVRKPEGKLPSEAYRHRWDEMKMDLGETGRGLDSSDLREVLVAGS
jgi:hypothetical protein